MLDDPDPLHLQTQLCAAENEGKVEWLEKNADRREPTNLCWLIAIVQQLLDHSAGPCAERCTERGQTAVSVAARRGHHAILRLLLEKGAHTNKTRRLSALL